MAYGLTIKMTITCRFNSRVAKVAHHFINYIYIYTLPQNPGSQLIFFTLIVEMYKTYFKSHTKYILDRDRDDNKLHEGVKKFHETAKNIAW